MHSCLSYALLLKTTNLPFCAQVIDDRCLCLNIVTKHNKESKVHRSIKAVRRQYWVLEGYWKGIGRVLEGGGY